MHERKDFDEGDPAHDAIEAQWMREMAGSDRTIAAAAMTSLFLAYRRLVLKRLTYWGGIPADRVADIAQQVWLEVWRAASLYRGDIPVRTFIFRRVDYGKRRYWSRRMNDPLGRLSEELTEEAIEPASRALAHTPANSSDYRAFALCVRKALDGFGETEPTLALLLFMRHVQERSLAEIAEMQGSEPNKIKGKLFSARDKFRPKVKRCLELWPQWGTGT